MLNSEAWRDISRKNKYSQSIAYNSIVWVYACVNVIANSISGCPIITRKGSSEDKNVIFNPLDKDIPTTTELIKRIFIYLETAGGCYLHIKKSKGEVKGVYLYSPRRIVPILERGSQQLLGWALYDRKTQRQVQMFTVREIIPILYFNPDRPYTGLAPLTAARFSAAQHFNMMNWNANYFKNGISSDLIVKYKKRLNDEQRKDIRKAIKLYASGVENGHGVLLLDGQDYDVDKGPGAISIKDLDFIEGNQLTREDICSVFGVPPAMVGIFRYANYANTLEQRKIFWEQSALPRMNYLKDLFQRLYLDEYFPGVTMDYDLSGISVLKLTDKEKAQISLFYRKAGKSWDEIADILDAPELAGPSVPLNNGGGDGSSDGLGGDAPETSVSSGFARKQSGSVRDREEVLYYQYGEAVRSLLQPLERSWSALLRATLLSIQGAMLSKIQNGDAPQLMEGAWLDGWKELSTPLVHKGMELAYNLVYQEVGQLKDNPKSVVKVPHKKEIVPIRTLLKDKWELEDFEKMVFQYTHKVVDVPSNVARELQLRSMEIYRAGGSIPDIRKSIRGLVDEIYKGRHLTIARTINGGAYNGARARAMQKAGVYQHRWVTARDSIVRESHSMVAGETVLFGTEFSNGLRFPHDPYGPPQEVINCRCTTAIVSTKDPDKYRPRRLPAEEVVPPVVDEAVNRDLGSVIFDVKGAVKEVGTIDPICSFYDYGSEAHVLRIKKGKEVVKRYFQKDEWLMMVEKRKRYIETIRGKTQFANPISRIQSVSLYRGDIIETRPMRSGLAGSFTKQGQKMMEDHLMANWNEGILKEAFHPGRLKLLNPEKASMCTRAFFSPADNAVVLPKKYWTRLAKYFNSMGKGTEALERYLNSLDLYGYKDLMEALETLHHEVGHYVHWNSRTISLWAQKFFDTRTAGESVGVINSNREVGKKDKFWAYYQGRIYPGGGNKTGEEVISMFVQDMGNLPHANSELIHVWKVRNEEEMILEMSSTFRSWLADADGVDEFIKNFCYLGN